MLPGGVQRLCVEHSVQSQQSKAVHLLSASGLYFGDKMLIMLSDKEQRIGRR